MGRRLAARPERGRAKLSTWERLLTPTTTLLIALGLGNGVDNFNIGTIFLSVVGAVILLVIYRLFTGRRRRFHL